MSDFTAIFEFLGTVVYHIFDQSINVVCGGLLLASMVVPWRIPEITREWSLDDWKWFCLFSLIQSIFDILGLICLFVGLLSPLRFVGSVVLIFRKFYRPFVDSESELFEERCACLAMIPATLCDLLCFPIGAITLCNPFGRQFALFFLLTATTPENAFSCCNCVGDSSFDVWRILSLRKSKYLMEYGAQTVLDLIVFILSLVILAVPTIWIGCFKGLRYQFTHLPRFGLITFYMTRAEQSEYDVAWNRWFEVIRELLFIKTMQAFIDLWDSFFLVLAAVMPFRNRQLMDAFAKSEAFKRAPTHEEEAAASAPQTDLVEIPDENGVVTVVHVPRNIPRLTFAPPSPDDFEFEYDFELRKNIFYIGALALSDLFLLPMLLPLYVTRYRYNAISKYLFKEDGTWGHEQLFLVVSQFLLLLVDVFTLWWQVPVLYITHIRWDLVDDILRDDPEAFLKSNCDIYAKVAGQFLLLLLDLFIVPFVLLLLCTHRHKHVWSAVTCKEAREDGCFLHEIVLLNVITLIHDLGLLIPIVMITAVLAPHRFPVVIDSLFYQPYELSATYLYYQKQGDNTTYFMQKLQLRDHFSSAWDSRIECWRQFFGGIIDVPFVLLGFFVMLTLWRAGNLIRTVREVRSYSYRYSSTPDNHNAQTLSNWNEYCDVVKSRSRKIRKVIWMEFVYLLRDFACLIPLSIVVGTCYRVPELISSIRNAFSADPLKSEPMYEVLAASVCFPAGGEPTVKFILKNKPNEKDFADLVVEPVQFDHFQLHVLGSTLWEQASKLFGGLLAGIAKSFLPLTLQQNKSVGWNSTTVSVPQPKEIGNTENLNEKDNEKDNVSILDVSERKSEEIVDPVMQKSENAEAALPTEKEVVLIPDNATTGDTSASDINGQNESREGTSDVGGVVCGVELDTDKDGDDSDKDNKRNEPSAPPLVTSSSGHEDALPMDCTCVWVNLPMKGVKKSTVAKKVNIFPQDVELMWQLESTVKGVPRVLFRHAMTMSDIGTALRVEETPVFAVKKMTLSEQLVLMGAKIPFVDDFHSLVLKPFFEILMDIAHFLMFFFTLRSPMRFYKLVRCMMEASGKTDLRLIEKILFSLNQAEVHLRQFRAALVPALNNISKECLGTRSYSYYGYYGYAKMNELSESASVYDWGRYQMLIKSIKRDLKLLCLNEDNFTPTVQNIMSGHDNVMMFWFLKYSTWMSTVRDERGDPLLQNDRRLGMELSSLVFGDAHDAEAKKLVALRMKLLNIYSEENNRVKDKKSKTPGFLKRSTDQNRSLIREYFRASFTDLVGVLMVTLLIVTLIRLVPTVRAVIENIKSPNPISWRSVIVKQIRLLQNDVYYLGLCLAYIFLLCVTVVGVPAFLADLPNNCESLKKIAKCAKKHVKEFFHNLCRLLSLVTVFRTYRMVFKASLFCVLLPGAFIGDRLQVVFGNQNESLRFWVGNAVYYGILIACIVEAVYLHNTDEFSTSLSIAQTANNSLLAISATIVGFVTLISVVFELIDRVRHPSQPISNPLDTKKLDLSWSHLVAVATGPLDCLQLSAVVMYFFWNPVKAPESSVVNEHLSWSRLEFGRDTLSAIMFWHSEDSAHTTIHRTAMTIAALLVLVWAMLIALPIAQSGKDSTSAKQIKMLKVRNSPVYDALYVFLSQSISVWLIATLMRSWSCFVESNDEAVLSTSFVTSCGGGDSAWSGAVAFAFLSYYAVTSAIVYSNSSQSIQSVEGAPSEGASFVRFSPTYVAGIKCIQLFVCASCFGAFGTAPAIAVLLPIIVVSLCGVMLPSLVSSSLIVERVCNVPSVISFRSAGFAATAWTATVCIVRSFADSSNSMQSTVIFASEGIVYVGWAAIFIGAAIHSWITEVRLRKDWESIWKGEGFELAINELLSTFSLALIETDNQRNFLSQSDTLMNDYKDRISRARSLQDMCVLVLRLENLIMVDKLSNEFLEQRKMWSESISRELTPSDANRTKASVPDVEQGNAADVAIRGHFRSFLNHVKILEMGFRQQSVSSYLSRDVLTILLSNKLPSDVCWYIFEYLVHVADLRKGVLQLVSEIYSKPVLSKAKMNRFLEELWSCSDQVFSTRYGKLVTDVRKQMA